MLSSCFYVSLFFFNHAFQNSFNSSCLDTNSTCCPNFCTCIITFDCFSPICCLVWNFHSSTALLALCGWFFIFQRLVATFAYSFDDHRTVHRNISVVKPTRCTSVSTLFYFGMTFYMFRTVFPSIISSLRQYIQLSNRYCCLLVSKLTAVSVWQMSVAVCTVLNCWWWTERPSETCRVSF